MPTARRLPFLAGLFCLIAAGALAGEQPAASLADLSGRTVAVLAGTIYGETAKKRIRDVRVGGVAEPEAALAALKSGKAAAFVHSLPVLAAMAEKDPAFRTLPETLGEEEYAFVVNRDAEKLAAGINEVLDEFSWDGTQFNLKPKWLSGPESARIIAEFNSAGANGALRLGVAAIGAPFVYHDADGNLLGYDVELFRLVAWKLSMKLEIVELPPAELFSALLAKKVDVIGAAITINPALSEKVRFTDSYHQATVGVLVPAE